MPSQQASSYPAPKPGPPQPADLPSPPKPEEAVLRSALEELEVTGSKANVKVTVYSWAGCTRWAVGLRSYFRFLHWVLCPGTELLPRKVPWASAGPPQLACFSLPPAPPI